jgi:predicted nucleic acid-binding protein
VLEKAYRVPFWDAMIVSSSLQVGCKILWTEDLNSGQNIYDLMIMNPYRSYLTDKKISNEEVLNA